MIIFCIIFGALHLAALMLIAYWRIRRRTGFSSYIRFKNDDLWEAVTDMIADGGGLDKFLKTIREKEENYESDTDTDSDPGDGGGV